MQEAGVLTRGEKLQDGTGRVLRRSRGSISITDGPYTESKEVIGGLFAVEAENYQAAVGIARECPHLEYGVVEIREVEIH